MLLSQYGVEENQGTPYSAIKLGLRGLLAKPKTELTEIESPDKVGNEKIAGLSST